VFSPMRSLRRPGSLHSRTRRQTRGRRQLFLLRKNLIVVTRPKVLIVAGHDVSPKTWIEEVRDLADYLEDYRSRTFPNPARWSSLSTGVPR